MKLFVKNMVCDRCIKVVKEVFEEFSLSIDHIKLGEIDITEDLDKVTLAEIDVRLREEGFEVIKDKNSRLISEIKAVIIRTIHQNPEILATSKMSDILTSNILYDYSYMSNLFCSVEGLTIERYSILQKTERVKELMIYDELTLGEIANLLGYSSTQHLSNQFKKITGLSPSYYKKLKASRKSLDKIG